MQEIKMTNFNYKTNYNYETNASLNIKYMNKIL